MGFDFDSRSEGGKGQGQNEPERGSNWKLCFIPDRGFASSSTRLRFCIAQTGPAAFGATPHSTRFPQGPQPANQPTDRPRPTAVDGTPLTPWRKAPPVRPGNPASAACPDPFLLTETAHLQYRASGYLARLLDCRPLFTRAGFG